MIDTHRLATDYIAAAVGDKATFYGTDLLPDTPFHLPAVVIGISQPVSITNGPREVAASFTVVVSCYAAGVDAAYDLARAVEAEVYRLWYERHQTPYGGITRIASSAGHPFRVSSDLEADDAARFDFTLPVIARTHDRTR